MIKESTIKYEEYSSFSELNSDLLKLIEEAYIICEKAYSPYSNFKVGSVLQLSNNKLVYGNNQENSAYPSGICAERVALFYAGANYSTEKVKTIVIVSKGDLIEADTVISPCGACRQVMIETENRQSFSIRVILVARNEKVVIFNSVKDLLPFYFGK